MVAGFLSQCWCMSLTVSSCCWLPFTVSPVPWNRYMSPTFSYGCWLSLTVSSVPKSCCMSLTVSPSAIEFLNVSHFLSWLLAFSHYLSSPKEFLPVSNCLSLLLAVCYDLFWSHGVAECLLLSRTFAGFLFTLRHWEKSLETASKEWRQ